MTKELDLGELMKALEEAYSLAGKQIQTAVLYGETEDGDMLVDNRKEEELN